MGGERCCDHVPRVMYVLIIAVGQVSPYWDPKPGFSSQKQSACLVRIEAGGPCPTHPQPHGPIPAGSGGHQGWRTPNSPCPCCAVASAARTSACPGKLGQERENRNQVLCLPLLPVGPVRDLNFIFVSTFVARNSDLGYPGELPWCLDAGWSGDDAGCERTGSDAGGAVVFNL